MSPAGGETMRFDVERVDCYSTNIEGRAGEVARLLSALAGAGVDFLAYSAVPLGPARIRLTVAAMDGSGMAAGVAGAGLDLTGPRPALYVRGEEEPGALAEIYERLSQARVDVGESSGLAHIRGGYGVILYLGQDDLERATAALAA
jgi:hypothetical protein